MRPLRLASTLLAACLAVLLLASTAQATEGITSLKTNLVESAAFGEAGEVVAAGTINGAPGASSFTLETYGGATDTVDVFPKTTFINADTGVGGPGENTEYHLGNLESGLHVVLFGALYGSTVNATRVLFAFGGEQPPSQREFAALGIVRGGPAGETFIVETRSGSTETVEASPSTTFSHARPLPGDAASPPTIADVRSGDYVAVSGTALGPDVAASSVRISTPQAGGHPDLETSFSLESPGSPEAAQNVVFDAPPGVFGNPRAATECRASEFALDSCPPDSQMGLITIHAAYEGNPDYLLGTAPVFTVVPQEGETARFAFIVPKLDIPIAIPVAVRTGSVSDYGLRFTVKDISQLTPIASAKMTFWGFPADSNHEAERFPIGSPGHPTGCPEEESTVCVSEPTVSTIASTPLTDNPTLCTGEALKSTLEVQTYQDPGHPSTKEATYQPIEGCENEKFEPVIQASPTTSDTDSASGLNLDLNAPQFETKAASPSEIKAITVTLPEGFTINPDAADGQSACTEAQANFGSEGPAACPDSSKIGTFSIGTPALAGRLQGALYLGEPKPGDQYRLFMIASGFGINAKLIGSFRPDPLTGRLIAEFPNLPQAPFDDFQLHLFSGERGLMATPTACSVYTVSAQFSPWNAALAGQTSNQVFSLDSGPHGSECPGQIRPFHPGLEAGTANATAGAFSNFALKLDREDGDQLLGKLGFTMPPGLTANLHGVTYCPEASITAAANTPGRTEQALPSCPASSQIGTSNVAAGPGSHPFHAVGEIYLAGPFQGAPLSLVAITPALAGPYDYGTVVVRVALHIDPLDAHVFADSETVPQVIGGIPIRMREIRVNINRPNFIINPTNCSELHTVSDGIGDQGTAVAFTSPFLAVNCATLPFKPKMTVTQLGGRKSTARGKDPSIRFDLNTRPGDVNLKSIAVTLPSALEIDQNHLGNLCARSELETTHCAGRQPIGTVKDQTPLLEAPLEGNAYAVAGYGGLPHVAFILAGQVTIIPQGESTQTNQGLRTEVPVVPDVPVGHFRLTLFGGKQGYLANTRSLCAHLAVTKIQYIAQNASALTRRVPIKAACGAQKRHKRHRH